MTGIPLRRPDGLSRLETVEQELEQTVSYLYDERGRLETVTNARGHVMTYGYFAWGGLDSVFHDLPGTVDDRTVSYAYDANGNLRSTADSAIDTPGRARTHAAENVS